jgi:hypothetical protein
MSHKLLSVRLATIIHERIGLACVLWGGASEVTGPGGTGDGLSRYYEVTEVVDVNIDASIESDTYKNIRIEGTERKSQRTFELSQKWHPTITRRVIVLRGWELDPPPNAIQLGRLRDKRGE